VSVSKYLRHWSSICCVERQLRSSLVVYSSALLFKTLSRRLISRHRRRH